MAVIEVGNVNHPGKVRYVDAEKYSAMRSAFLQVLPKTEPGLTIAETNARILPLLSAAIFPGGAKAGWWAKTVQLDLEAKGLAVRSKGSPVRLWRSDNHAGDGHRRARNSGRVVQDCEDL
jgi:hypothetical protein